MQFIHDCGQSAFPGWTHDEMRRALVYAGANSRLQIFVANGKVEGLCVWAAQPERKNIHVVALIGNRGHANFMRTRWRNEHPECSVSFMRGNRTVQFESLIKD